MCEPTTMVMMQVASGMMTYMAAQDAADAQTKQNQAYANDAQASHEREMKMLDRRMEEEKTASVQAEQDVIADAREKKATAIASAGESGVSGISVEALLNEVDYQEGTILTRNLGSTKNKLASLTDDKEKSYATMVSRFNSLKPVTQPSFLGTALEVGAGLSQTVDFKGTTDNSKWELRT